MTTHTRYRLRWLYGTLVAVACAGWFVDPTISLIVVVAACYAAGIAVMGWFYTVPGEQYRKLPAAVLLALAFAGIAGAVICYFVEKRIEWPSFLLAMGIECLRTLIKDQDGKVRSTV